MLARRLRIERTPKPSFQCIEQKFATLRAVSIFLDTRQMSLVRFKRAGRAVTMMILAINRGKKRKNLKIPDFFFTQLTFTSIIHNCYISDTCNTFLRFYIRFIGSIPSAVVASFQNISVERSASCRSWPRIFHLKKFARKQYMMISGVVLILGQEYNGSGLYCFDQGQKVRTNTSTFLETFRQIDQPVNIQDLNLLPLDLNDCLIGQLAKGS